MTIEHLTKADRDEILAVLNASFSHGPTAFGPAHTADFEAALPVMWQGEPTRECRHLGIRMNSRIVALLGVYPLPAKIAEEDVLFCTIGNVGTLAEARGLGLMHELMSAALEEAQRMGASAARLGGLRSRYTRWGFDHAGSVLVCSFTQRNAQEYPGLPDVTFSKIAPENQDAIRFARSCHDRKAIHCLRTSDPDFYYTMCAWQNVPLMARKADGEPIGYLCVSPDGTSVAEWGVAEGMSVCALMGAYLKSRPETEKVRFEVQPAELSALRDVKAFCECWHWESPSMFRIFRWDMLTDALMKLAAQTRGLPEGRLSLGIEGWGTLCMSVKDSVPSAEKTEEAPECRLSALEAEQWLFGSLPGACPIPGNRPETAWFPLPLTWNGQDRV